MNISELLTAARVLLEVALQQVPNTFGNAAVHFELRAGIATIRGLERVCEQKRGAA